MYVIAAALEGEIKAFKKRLNNTVTTEWAGITFYRGDIEGLEVLLVAGGVGKTVTAAVLQYILDRFVPEACIYVGLAGSLDDNLTVGDVIVADSCVQWDFDVTRFGFKKGETPETQYRVVTCDESLVSAALAFGGDAGNKDGLRIQKGRILTGDTFLTKRRDKEHAFLCEELEGKAVDMEGYGAGLVARLNDIPFLLVRVVSDNADGKITVKFPKMLLTASKRLYDIVIHTLKVYKK